MTLRMGVRVGVRVRVEILEVFVWVAHLARGQLALITV